jgi:hypothetical protein
LYLIGIRHFVVEVDARYIKGMLANPDLNPSASVNCWILSILTFHFNLIHVPGTMHSPDGMSRRHLQPGDEPEPDDAFDDWINNLYGFMHLINRSPSVPTSQASIAIFVSDVADIELPQEDVSATSYANVPRSDQANADDNRLCKVRLWLDSLVRLDNVSDSDYTAFI